ncbi:SURF1 family protein [Corynebacterium lehmanniae]|uniref:SURF1-like protein n=1 Tax=Corynebacterium lehmanniae TaxID=2913497 RepID=A0ABT4R712_9CORY|nr:SURF1 family cytochrome oxidase biogenesis protein [Corynebacterium lehmanniae]MCZ9291341.1 SURF1 family protein [Corynebacterium lehmanniae]
MSAKNQTSKPWWRQMLTPGWVIAALLIGVFSYYAFTFLAPWQLGKNEALVERNEHISAAFEHDPEPLSSRVGADGSLRADAEWSRVVATGHYTGQDVLLRLRPVDGTPAFQVLTPFVLDDGRAIVVHRGWVKAENSTQVPAVEPAPTGEVTLTGLLRADEGEHPNPPMHEQGYDMVYSISPTQIGSLTGTDVVSPYLQLLGGEPGVLDPIPLPQLETGNHLSYGLQWILFGLAAPAGLIYFLYSDSRERRRFEAEQEQLLLDDTPAGSPDPTAPAAPTRQRYGSSRANPWAKAYDKEEER